MIDKRFFRKYSQDIVNKYRKLIFDIAGAGTGARDVYGRKMGQELSNVDQQKAMWAESTDPTTSSWLDVGQTYSTPT